MKRAHRQPVFALLLLLTAGIGCRGASPNQPTPARFGLPDGVYLLDLISFDFSTDPSVSPCAPVGSPPAGKIVAVRLRVTREGASYVGRSLDPSQTLQLELREATTDEPFPARFEGTLRGYAVDEGHLLSAARDVDVLVGDSGGPALVTGISTPEPATPFLDGRAAGAVVFSDSEGRLSRCQTVDFTMQPLVNVP